MDKNFDYLGLLTRKPGAIQTAPTGSSTFIIGCRRSGSTLLSWILDSHPAFAVVPENHLCAALFDPLISNMRNRGVLPMLADRLGEDRRVFLGRMATMIDGVFTDYASRLAKPQWVAKELFVANSLDMLDAAFSYQSKFLFLTRHGLDVAASIVAKFGFTSPEAATSGFPLEAACLEWRKNTELTLGFCRRNSDRVYHLKYEDLVAEPQRCIEEIFQFLGVDCPSPSLQDTIWSQPHAAGLGADSRTEMGSNFERTRMHYWRDFPKQVLDQLAPVVEGTLHELGYEFSLCG